jgi:hypothetical protein
MLISISSLLLIATACWMFVGKNIIFSRYVVPTLLCTEYVFEFTKNYVCWLFTGRGFNDFPAFETFPVFSSRLSRHFPAFLKEVAHSHRIQEERGHPLVCFVTDYLSSYCIMDHKMYKIMIKKYNQAVKLMKEERLYSKIN